jgi:hypothetical protein
MAMPVDQRQLVEQLLARAKQQSNKFVRNVTSADPRY